MLTLCISIPVGIATAAMQKPASLIMWSVSGVCVGNALPNFISSPFASCFIFPTVSVDSCVGDDKAYRPYPSCAIAGAGHVVQHILADRAAMFDELGVQVVGLRSRTFRNDHFV